MGSNEYIKWISKDSGKYKKVEQAFLSGIEIFAYIIIGLYFYDTTSNQDVGIIVWFVGISLVINRNITNHFDKESYERIEERIDRIGQVIDIENETNIDIVSKVCDSYLNITEREFSKVKNDILNKTLAKLDKIKIEKCSDELPTSEYYSWLFPILENVKKHDSIRAVSCMLTAEWDDSTPERRFIKGNLEAAKKGVIVERIFVMDRNILNDALQIDSVNQHTKEQMNKTKLRGFFADKGKLNESNESELLKSIGDGFIIFKTINKKVAVIEFSEGTSVRGIVTMNENIIRDLEETFGQLKMISSELSTSLIAIPNSHLSKKDE